MGKVSKTLEMFLGSNTLGCLLCILRLFFVLGLFCIPCKSGVKDSFGCYCCGYVGFALWQLCMTLVQFENSKDRTRKIDVIVRFLLAPYKKRLKL